MGEHHLTAEVIAANIAASIKIVRAQRGLTLQDVADRAGLAKAHVWEIEKGRSRNPTVDTAFRLSRALGLSLDELTGRVSDQPTLHPEAMRIACEIDALLSNRAALSGAPDHD